MSATNRAPLVSNAVSFLKDPQTQHAPMEKRIEFLRAKGLTQPEIDEAFQQVGLSSSVPLGSTFASSGTGFAVPASSYSQPSYAAPYTYQPQPQLPPVPQRDWRDYFIMAMISGGVMFGVVSLAKKYLFPHLVPPPLDAFQQSQKDLERQFDELAAQLNELQTSTQAELKLVEEQKADVDKAVQEVNEVVQEVKDGEGRMRSEMQEIREEVGNIRDMLPKLMQSSQANATATLEDLQQELKSLKALLLSRPPTFSGGNSPGGAGGYYPLSGTASLPYGAAAPLPLPRTGGSGSSTLLPGTGRSSIPAWQLASKPAPTPTSSAQNQPPALETKPDGGAGSSMGDSGILVNQTEEASSA